MKGIVLKSVERIAYMGIISFGLISLLGDIIYEGARGIISPYLETLGATAVVVGVVGGLGDFLGYALRLVSGYIADVKRTYWLLVFLGYGLLVSIPLLAFANLWQIAIILILVERIAKALRSPARDTLLSVISSSVGSGKAFGLHELLDQIGAILGPGIVALTLLVTGNYSNSFIVLIIPYAILMLVLTLTYSNLKTYTSSMVPSAAARGGEKGAKLPLRFKIYTMAVFFNTLGLIHILLILYKASPIMASWTIPLLYLFVQAVDAVSAIISGYAYDVFGMKILVIPFALSIIPPILAVTGGLWNIIVASIVFGIILGMQESTYRAAVSDTVPVGVSGTAYGIFNSLYGLGYLVSGYVYGLLLDSGLVEISALYALITQLASITLLYKSTFS